MIISHKYKYVFIELPMTGSTAIAQELVQYYDGQKILSKHASPKDFKKMASPEEQQYFMFSGIRNPLDETVSRYLKYKTDHGQRFSQQLKKKKDGHFRRMVNRIRDKVRYNYILKNGASFSKFFYRYYSLPYSNWSMVWHHQMDFILRFDHLNEDFMSVLNELHIEPERQLPQKNKTGGKDKVFWDFYDTPEMKQRAANVFGAFMEHWHFPFPDGWPKPTQRSKALFPIVHRLRCFYWTQLR